MHDKKVYDFIVTGASGGVGRSIIPKMTAKGAKVLAIGRDAEGLSRIYSGVSGVDIGTYAELDSGIYANVLIHLAIRNNDKSGTLDEFIAANVDLARDVALKFRAMSGLRFINFSSVQSLQSKNESLYVSTKNQSLHCLDRILGDHLDNVYIGYVYDEGYYGRKFSNLLRLGWIGKSIFKFLKLLTATTSASEMVDYIFSDQPSLSDRLEIITDQKDKSLVYRFVVRFIDVLLAIFILTIFFPVLILISVMVKVDSAGPAIFKQNRVGLGERSFTLYKFRTMGKGTASVATHQVDAGAVTKVGSFLRRTKLDELPQAVNLLRGDMTLVGPRPCLSTQDELIAERRKYNVFSVRPGLTGLAQIDGIDMSKPRRLSEVDFIYIKLRSLVLNFKIILYTASGKGRGDRIASGVISK